MIASLSCLVDLALWIFNAVLTCDSKYYDLNTVEKLGKIMLTTLFYATLLPSLVYVVVKIAVKKVH